MNSILNKILAGIGANVFGQIVTVTIQLLSVPIFLNYWNIDVYGKWIMLSAVPAYFSMADIGLVSVAANRMAILSSRGDHLESNKVFQSALLLTASLIVVFFIIAVAVVLLVNFDFLSDEEIKIALLILIFVALANVFSGVFEAVFRAAENYALGTYFINSSRAVEWLFGIVFLVSGYGFVGVAFGFLMGRIASIFGMYFYTVKKFNNIEWGISKASINELQKMFRPAIAFMAFPVGNAISLQGMTLFVGAVFGPVFLALFNTYRTFSRVLVQFVAVFTRSVWPEVSKLYGNKDFLKIKEINKKGTYFIGVICTVLAIGLFLLAEIILHYWTHDKIPYEPRMLGFLLATSVITAFWQLPMVVTMATNTHEKLSYFYVFASVMTLVISLAFNNVLGEYVVVVALLFFEILMMFSSHWVVNGFLRREIG